MDRGHGVFSHCPPNRIIDIVCFPSTTMATPEAALKLEIARLTGICLFLPMLMFSINQIT